MSHDQIHSIKELGLDENGLMVLEVDMDAPLREGLEAAAAARGMDLDSFVSMILTKELERVIEGGKAAAMAATDPSAAT